jgi:8-oxo-dGTP pyrophosphatase MutT (NUDIX family)
MTILLGAAQRELDRFLASDRPVDDPHQHAVGIAWVIDSVENQLLLVRHRSHGWSCPGGHLEPGEAPAHAASRELAEEAGITATPLSFEPVVIVRELGCPRAPGNDRIVHWAFGYQFEASCAERLDAEPGQPVQWFPLGALPHHRPRDIDEVLIHLGLAT